MIHANSKSKGQKVFISYAHKDGGQLAQQLGHDLATAGLDVWVDTARIAGGATWTQEIEHALDTCEVAITLLTPCSYASELCRAEQLRALRKGKFVIPVLAHPSTEVPLHLEAKHYRDFSCGKPYLSELEVLVDDIRNRKNGVTLREDFRTTYVTAPPLPRNYVERPEALLGLRDVLIRDGSGPSIALTALKGMGGIGKTILAQALCSDEVVQQAFPDGVIWIAAGKEPAWDIITRMREVGKALQDDLSAYDSELGCKNRYRSTLRQKAALIVIDDVWRAVDLAPFLADSPRSRILFTTRDGTIAGDVGAEEHTADLLTTKQSRELLARWSGRDVQDLPPESDDLMCACGRLPLCLSMIGAMMRNKPNGYWKHVNNLLRNADLANIKAQFTDYAHPNLLRAIKVSVDALDPKERSRYLALAVLLEGMPARSAIQQTLWSTDELDALNTAEQFVSLSLAQREIEPGSIRLHDLQLDYVRAQYLDCEALHLIHGAVRLSGSVIEKDPWQFTSQVTGRLLSHKTLPAVDRFLSSLAHAGNSLCLLPLKSALHPPGTALIRTLEGHCLYVLAVAVSPNGQQAVSVSEDNILKVWDLETGRELRTLEGHTDAVCGVAITPDGLQAVSASRDNTLKVWDLDTGRELRTLIGHEAYVFAVTVTPEGCRVVSASRDTTLKVWDLEMGRELRTLKGHTGCVSGVVVTPDGRHIVSASWDKTLKIWDLETGQELRTLKGHTGCVSGVVVTPDACQVVSASWDKTLKVWHLETGRELRTLEGHAGCVSGVAITPDGRQVVSSSWDKMLKVWDLEAGRELRMLGGHSGFVSGVAVTPDGDQVVSASWDNTVKVWDLGTRREVRIMKGHSGPVSAVAVIVAEGRQVISASWDNTLKIWELGAFLEIRTLEGHSGSVSGVAVSINGQRAVSASRDKTLKVWDLQAGCELNTLKGHSGFVSGVVLSPDGRQAISASWDNTLKVWDLETGRVLRTLSGHFDSVLAVAVSPDGRLAVSASKDTTLKIWDLETGRQLRTLRGHVGFVSSVAITPDGRRAISASWDKMLKVWDLETGRELSTLEGHCDSLSGVGVNPHGRLAVSASKDKTIRVWDLEAYALLGTFTCDAAARCCAFADAHMIIGGDEAGLVHFLSLAGVKS